MIELPGGPRAAEGTRAGYLATLRERPGGVMGELHTVAGMARAEGD